MNPLQPSNDLYFQISSSNYSLPIQTISEDQIFHDPVMDGTDLHLPCNSSQMGKDKQQRKQLPANWRAEANYKNTPDENKKWMHRETEKQRRQEMARLFTSFRSLLPFEYIKGKRSTSDYMHEGTNYIKYLENKVKQLEAKRDELMKLSNLSPVGLERGSFTTTTTTTNLSNRVSVIVHPCLGGVQIKCGYSFRKYEFPLSRVLDIVLQEGLNMVNCTSIKTDDHRFIHTILSEDPHSMTETDYSEVQRKLVAAISSSSLEETV